MRHFVSQSKMDNVRRPNVRARMCPMKVEQFACVGEAIAKRTILAVLVLAWLPNTFLFVQTAKRRSGSFFFFVLVCVSSFSLCSFVRPPLHYKWLYIQRLHSSNVQRFFYCRHFSFFTTRRWPTWRFFYGVFLFFC